MIQNWFLAVFTGLMVVACLFAAILVDSLTASRFFCACVMLRGRRNKGIV
ncbi:hypothetical protein ACVMFA_000990 [Bradyrhizobium liaoningense]